MGLLKRFAFALYFWGVLNPINLHIALYLLPLVVLLFSLQLASLCTACPKSTHDVACKLHDKAAGGEARGRFTESEILEQTCVLVVRRFQRSTFLEFVVWSRCLSQSRADMMALDVSLSSLVCLLTSATVVFRSVIAAPPTRFLLSSARCMACFLFALLIAQQPGLVRVAC